MGDFFKNVEILCYFGSFFLRFCAVRKLFGVFLTYFENSTEILCYFLSYFLKSSEFGRSPKIREQATTLLAISKRGNSVSRPKGGPGLSVRGLGLFERGWASVEANASL